MSPTAASGQGGGVDTSVLMLPITLTLCVLALLWTVLSWRRRSTDRVLRGLAVAVAAPALLLTGLLPMVVDAVLAVVRWAGRVVFSPTVWTGFAMLAIAVVLWVLGGVLLRRRAVRSGSDTPAVAAGGSTRRGGATPRSTPTADPELDEIEQMLRQRGIE